MTLGTQCRKGFRPQGVGRSAVQKIQEGDPSMAETDWLIEAKTAYERGNAYAAAAAALIAIANTLRLDPESRDSAPARADGPRRPGRRRRDAGGAKGIRALNRRFTVLPVVSFRL